MHSGKKLFKTKLVTKLVMTEIVKIDCMTVGHVRGGNIQIEIWKYSSGGFVDTEVRKRPA
jgi:hypothetical protein